MFSCRERNTLLGTDTVTSGYRPRPGRARLPEARPTQLAHETPGPRRHPAATTDGSETELTGLPLNLPAVTPLPGGHLTPP